jgi:peptidoglycan lytic transglycosylase
LRVTGAFATIVILGGLFAPASVGAVRAPEIADVSISAAVAAGKKLSKRERKIWREAFTAADHRQWKRAKQIAGRSRNKLLRKIFRWYRMTQRNAGVSFPAISKFVAANPDWPRQRELVRRAEEAMTTATPPAEIRAWFSRHPTLTTDGGIMLGVSLMGSGKRADGIAVLRNTWVEGNFGRKQSRGFYRRFRKTLRGEDHRDRMERLLWDRKFSQARRMMSLVPAGDRLLAQARMRLRLFRGGIDWAIRRVPDRLKQDPGLVYERLRWRLRKKRLNDAVEILANPPAELVRPEKWWRERSRAVRPLLVQGRAEEAYRFVHDHGLNIGREFAEAEWLSGWIALRFLKRPADARRHFKRLHDAVRYPISRARAAYWAGRAAEADGDAKAAQNWYSRAAAHSTTYYGQLGVDRAGSVLDAVSRDEPVPNAAAIARTVGSELARAAILLNQLERGKLVRSFVLKLARASKSADHKLLTGRLASAMGRRDIGVEIARRAYRGGIALPSLGYPVIAMPVGVPEPGLMLAVARQESNMDTKAKSRAGALGLMQIMPRTAQVVSRDLRIRYSRARLTRDPRYNIKLGRAYLRRLLKRFNGSYILSIAAYNAGPSAVKRWIKMIGGPGTAKFDAIDWIEMIPYPETRNYVQRVLENLQVYRQRLGQTRVARSLEADLAR